jgi:peptidoglycan hydrolase CwlO-like protein
MVDDGATPKFNTGMFLSVHTNTSPVALEDCSHKELSKEHANEGPMEVIPQRKHYEYEDQLIQRQDEIIKALEKQISDAEEELFEKDNEIARLENDLEEVCEELFLEVNLR